MAGLRTFSIGQMQAPPAHARSRVECPFSIFRSRDPECGIAHREISSFAAFCDGRKERERDYPQAVPGNQTRDGSNWLRRRRRLRRTSISPRRDRPWADWTLRSFSIPIPDATSKTSIASNIQDHNPPPNTHNNSKSPQMSSEQQSKQKRREVKVV